MARFFCPEKCGWVGHSAAALQIHMQRKQQRRANAAAAAALDAFEPAEEEANLPIPNAEATGTATGTVHDVENHDDHCCREVIQILKETGDLHTFFVFGASLDSTIKKIYPTIWAMYRNEMMPKKTAIVCYDPSELTLTQFRIYIGKYIKLKDAAEVELFGQFLQHNVYFQGKYNSPNSFRRLVKTVEKMEQTDDDGGDAVGNRLFYLAIPRSVFEPVTQLIHDFVMSKSGWNRLIIDKPFGHDSESYEKLSRNLQSLYNKEELYRIDHNLGKEMVQNLMVLRFGNRIFDPIWNHENIQSVYISFKEPFGTIGSGDYFDQFGIIRDVMQNHLLQNLCLVAMKKPVSINPEDIRDEKVKVLRAMKALTLDDVVLGQYIGNPNLDGDAKLGYRNDKTVRDGSLTPTFALAMCKINNERWDGVPFFMRCGKALNEHKTEIRIQFRDISDDIFGGQCKSNELVIRGQPNEAINVKFMCKSPGMTFQLEETELNLTNHNRYKDFCLPDAYERLIMDVFAGSQMHFVRSDELAESWRVLTPLLHDIESKKIEPLPYLHSSRGPKQADDFCINNGFKFYGTYRKHFFLEIEQQEAEFAKAKADESKA